MQAVDDVRLRHVAAPDFPDRTVAPEIEGLRERYRANHVDSLAAENVPQVTLVVVPRQIALPGDGPVLRLKHALAPVHDVRVGCVTRHAQTREPAAPRLELAQHTTHSERGRATHVARSRDRMRSALRVGWFYNGIIGHRHTTASVLRIPMPAPSRRGIVHTRTSAAGAADHPAARRFSAPCLPGRSWRRRRTRLARNNVLRRDRTARSAYRAPCIP